MGKIIIDNVPNVVLSEVEEFLRAVVKDDVKPMLENAGFSIPEHQAHAWNLHSHAEGAENEFKGDHVVYGGAIHELVEVEVSLAEEIGGGHTTMLVASPHLLEAMGDPNHYGEDESDIDEYILYYADYETWETRENMTNEDWLAYLTNELRNDKN